MQSQLEFTPAITSPINMLSGQTLEFMVHLDFSPSASANEQVILVFESTNTLRFKLDDGDATTVDTVLPEGDKITMTFTSGGNNPLNAQKLQLIAPATGTVR